MLQRGRQSLSAWQSGPVGLTTTSTHHTVFLPRPKHHCLRPPTSQPQRWRRLLTNPPHCQTRQRQRWCLLKLGQEPCGNGRVVALVVINRPSDVRSCLLRLHHGVSMVLPNASRSACCCNCHRTAARGLPGVGAVPNSAGPGAEMCCGVDCSWCWYWSLVGANSSR